MVPVRHDADDVFNRRERGVLASAETVTRVAEAGVPDADYEAAARRPNLRDQPDERLISIRDRVPLDPCCRCQSLNHPTDGRSAHGNVYSLRLTSLWKHEEVLTEPL